MRRFVDLHTHSTASDGQHCPAELVRLADRAGLAGIALTDHDTLAGLAEARAAARGHPDLRFACGLEVSARSPSGTMHVLAYAIDDRAGPLQEIARRFRAARDERNPKILSRLQELGVRIDMDDVLAAADHGDAAGRQVVSRVHIARALVRKGHAKTTQEAFDRYIAQGAPAYVEKEVIDPDETIAAIHASGGLAVLAHPSQLKCRNSAQLEQILRRLIAHGLDGVEVHHSDHTPEQTRLYVELARRHGLFMTGGSDFHGSSKPEVVLGRPRVPLDILSEELAERIFDSRPPS